MDFSQEQISTYLSMITSSKIKQKPQKFLREKIIQKDPKKENQIKQEETKEQTKVILDVIKYEARSDFFSAIFQATFIREKNSYLIVRNSLQKKMEKVKKELSKEEEQWKMLKQSVQNSKNGGLSINEKFLNEVSKRRKGKNLIEVIKEVNEQLTQQQQINSQHSSEELSDKIKQETQKQNKQMQIAFQNLKKQKQCMEDILNKILLCLSLTHLNEIQPKLRKLVNKTVKKQTKEVSCQCFLPNFQIQAQFAFSLQQSLKILKFNRQVQTSTAEQDQSDFKGQSEFFKGDLFDNFILPEKNSENPSQNMIDQKIEKQIFSPFSCQKKFLIHILQQYMDQKIIQTRLLYAYDPLNQNSFHHYVDGYTNLILIARLKNGYIVGGFSAGMLKQGLKQSCPGFIASLTNKCYFKIDNTHSPLTYQPYFMTFGNSELRVKIPGKKIFSNMGVVNTFFISKEKDPTVLFGSKQREKEVDHYEIHKVFFNG